MSIENRVHSTGEEDQKVCANIVKFDERNFDALIGRLPACLFVVFACFLTSITGHAVSTSSKIHFKITKSIWRRLGHDDVTQVVFIHVRQIFNKYSISKNFF